MSPSGNSRRIELASISDARWRRVRSHVPAKLSAETDARLRGTILECCSWFLTEQARLHEGRTWAAALQRPSRRQLAPLERFLKGLRLAADAWSEVQDFYDDPLSDVRRFDQLQVLARCAERRVAEVRSLGKPGARETPWREFVRRVANCFLREGITPETTGRVYENGAKLAWFQKFMAALQKEVLGFDGRPWPAPREDEIEKNIRARSFDPNIRRVRSADSKNFDREAPRKQSISKTAFAAEITKALGGDTKTGKARK